MKPNIVQRSITGSKEHQKLLAISAGGGSSIKFLSEPIEETLGSRLHKMREARDLRVREVSQCIGISSSQIYMLEKCESCNTTTLIKFTIDYNCTSDELLGIKPCNS